ncbi:MAG TPA: FAD/NAD(P)-binding protein [Candidatus Polarisedimenticolia bacterium]|nr:FAD/NAD(P)-binding protein [Candidatus Polarisedimenticolia bacterium]
MEDRTRDRDLGMNRSISRRDFLNGVAIGGAGALAGGWLSARGWAVEASEIAAQDRPGYYPPALTGMRGSTDGSYEAAHALRDGDFWKKAGPPVDTKEAYDLVVVGGGISGLAAAYFYRRQNPAGRVLILDNHDDFGGHARRNEFRSGGRLLLANGGTYAIESPTPYSAVSRGLMTDLGIDPPALAAECEARSVYKGMKWAYFFDRQTFGVDRLVTGAPGGWFGKEGDEDWQGFLAKTPLSPEVRRDIARLQETGGDPMPGLSSDEKKDRLSRTSYKDFLVKVLKVDPGVIPFYQTATHSLYGVGIDAVPAIDCWGLDYPGFKGLNLAPGPYSRMGYTAKGYATPAEPYHFHFPDGNASIARLLVRALIPGAMPGRTAKDVVTSKVRYAGLDRADSPVRLRLNSTAVRVRHVGDRASSREVEVAYARAGKVDTVRGRGVVMACWNMVIPYLCPELPDGQKEALRYGTKVPLVYTVVALRNWKAFQRLGVRGIFCPGMYHADMYLDHAVNIGDYRSPAAPEEPILLRLTRTPCQPGLPERDQHRAGWVDLLSTPFETFERSLRDQLARVLGPGGFDPARDISAITVNRWPHGYAYEYNPLFDPDWPEGERPCDVGRKPFGRITIANSDAAAAAYTDQAIDQAYRAVRELTT